MNAEAKIAALSVLVLQAGAQAGLVGTMDDVLFWTGSGSNRAVLVIDWNDGKAAPGSEFGESLAWGFRWPTGEARTGEQLVRAIDLADPRLDVAFDNHGGTTMFGVGYDLDGDGGTYTFDRADEDGTATDSDDHFAEGWFNNGFWGYLKGSVSGNTRPAFTESTGPFYNRILTNGSWDAWSFTTDVDGTDGFFIPSPGVPLAAIPEPSTTLLLLLSGGLAAVRRRR